MNILKQKIFKVQNDQNMEKLTKNQMTKLLKHIATQKQQSPKGPIHDKNDQKSTSVATNYQLPPTITKIF